MAPQPGDFGLTTIPGDGGKLIRFGQWLNGDGFLNFEHAFLVLNDGLILEAEPHGAVITKNYHDEASTIYSNWQLTPEQRLAITMTRHQLLNTPYSWLDYASIAMLRLHIRPPGLKSYIRSSGHMICSQLVDAAYALAGLKMFDDNRFPGDVTPASLIKALHGPVK